MSKGKYTKSTFHKKKPLILLASLVLLLTMVIVGTIAFLSDDTTPIVNTFESVDVTSRVHENVSGNTKSDVKIENTGDVDAYLRAAVVINWLDSDGNVCATAPVDGSYTITGLPTITSSTSADTWFKGSDGYYYYTSPVAAGAMTENLIVTCTATTVPAGYQLSVDILCGAVQADGVASDGTTKPVVDAWGVTMSGSLVTGK